MKSIGTLLGAFWLFAFSLSAQTERTVTIEKTTVLPNGDVKSEMIIKTGEDAEAFDTEDYLAKNKEEKIIINIVDSNGNQERYVRMPAQDRQEAPKSEKHIIIKDGTVFQDEEVEMAVMEGMRSAAEAQRVAREAVREAFDEARRAMEEFNDDMTEEQRQAREAMREALEEASRAIEESRMEIIQERREMEEMARQMQEEQAFAIAAAPAPPNGFLGVSPMGEDDDSKEGIRVKVIQNSSAEKAGLKNGDEIIQLDDMTIDSWEDIKKFMSSTKPGQQIKIRYHPQGGKPVYTISAQLTDRNNTGFDWRMMDLEEENWMEVHTDEMTKDACLGVYSEADDNGARVTDFTATSAALSAGMKVGDVITSVNGEQVSDHEDLWNEIAKFRPEETIKIEFKRDGEIMKAEVRLNSCDTQNKITFHSEDDGGEDELSSMYIWDWTKESRERLRNAQVITIQKAGQGDVPTNPNYKALVPEDKQLKVRGFKAFPEEADGPMTVTFKANPVPTIVTFYDDKGHEVFREELNSFSGDYEQKFDLSAHANSTLTVHIQQGDKWFSEALIVEQ